ncbi:hypothetical protein ACVW19_000592 [Streptomyces sp. TE5632]
MGARPVLGEAAQRGGALLEGVEPPALVDAGLWERTDPDGHRRDDAEGPLGPQDELAQVGPGRRARGPAGVEGAFGGGEGEGEHHLVEAAVPGGRLAAGACRGEAADGRPLVGLWEVTEGETVFGEQRLGLRGAQAGLQGGGAGDRVEVEQGVHTPQVQGDEGALPTGGETADHGGAAAERHHGQALFGTDTQGGEHLVVAGGEQDGRRDVGDVTVPDPQQVGGGLAARVPDPRLRVGTHMVLAAQRLDQRAVRGGRQPGLGHGHFPEGHRPGRARLDAEQIAQQPDHRVGQRRRPRRVAPAAPQHVHDCRPHRSVRASI